MNSYWLVVTGCHQFGIFPEILGLSSSQLTHSYFSEGFVPTTNQLKTWYPTSEVFCRIQLSENWGGGFTTQFWPFFFGSQKGKLREVTSVGRRSQPWRFSWVSKLLGSLQTTTIISLFFVKPTTIDHWSGGDFMGKNHGPNGHWPGFQYSWKHDTGNPMKSLYFIGNIRGFLWRFSVKPVKPTHWYKATYLRVREPLPLCNLATPQHETWRVQCDKNGTSMP